MDLKLEGRSAMVSGSTAGIGYAIASALAREGAAVVVNGRTKERVAAAVDRIAASVPKAKLSGVAADLSTEEGAEALFRHLPETDILVNNLGIFEAKPFGKITDREWRQFFETNVLSGVRLSRHYLPGMMSKNWGRVIFISSESALNIPVEMIHYGMTKTAQLSVARGLAEMTVGTNVTVNAVLPGPTRSEGVEGFIEGMAAQQGLTGEQVEKQFFEKARPSSILKRFIAPEEVAALVAFVASPLASATNGAALRVDGGVVRSIV
jgi:NAD(P)-dependent dehydrogenase (short-subunit alcohol dehydrogenase family)